MECAVNSQETFTSLGRTLCVTLYIAPTSLAHVHCIPETIPCSLLKMLEGKGFPNASVAALRGKVRVSSREPRNTTKSHHTTHLT